MTAIDVDILLKPYSICVIELAGGRTSLMLAIPKSSSMLYAEDNDGWGEHVLGFGSLNDIVEALCSQIKRFIIFEMDNTVKTAENIYLGCKSLDEMLVRKDLHEGSCLWQTMPC